MLMIGFRKSFSVPNDLQNSGNDILMTAKYFFFFRWFENFLLVIIHKTSFDLLVKG